MDNQPASINARGASTLDGEIASISAAIELIAGGAASRVTLAGLQFGAALIPVARTRAGGRCVRVRPLWPMGDGPVDLVLEAVEPGEAVGQGEPDV